MKLGDILPHWIFRERAGIDAEIGGASAFPHLAEDAEAEVVRSSWGFYGALPAHPDVWAGFDAADPDTGRFALDVVTPVAGDVAVHLGVAGEPSPRFEQHGDGSFHWGDGSAAPAVSLAHNAGGLELRGSSGLQSFGADASLYASQTDDYSTGYAGIDARGHLVLGTAVAQLDAEPNAGFRLFAAAATDSLLRGTVSGEADPRVAVDVDGSFHWGGGAAALDTSLRRIAPGALQLGEAVDHVLTLTEKGVLTAWTPDADVANRAYGIGAWSDAQYRFRWNGDGKLEWGDGTGAPDVSLSRSAAGVLQIPDNGGGLRLTSPDGTKTRTIRLSNAGAVEVIA